MIPTLSGAAMIPTLSGAAMIPVGRGNDSAVNDRGADRRSIRLEWRHRDADASGTALIQQPHCCILLVPLELLARSDGRVTRETAKHREDFVAIEIGQLDGLVVLENTKATKHVCDMGV